MNIHTTHSSFDNESRLYPSAAREQPTSERAVSVSRDEVLVVAKRSRYERDAASKGLNDTELQAYYESLGESGARVLASHLHNKHSIEICRAELSPAQVVQLEEFIAMPNRARYKVVVALGGDDFFKLVGQLVSDDQMVLGVASSSFSTGAILSLKAEDFPTMVHALGEGRYSIQNWTRPRVFVDGVDHGTATNEIIIGKRDFRCMSKHILEYRGERVVQYGSGLLISNGSGSTGWFSSAGIYLGSHDRTFPPDAPFLRFEQREPKVIIEEGKGGRTIRFPPHVEGTIERQESLRVVSLLDDEGIVSRDGFDDIPFPRGSIAEIVVDSKPLRVIKPQSPL